LLELAEHLQAVRPLVDEFARAHGFELVDPRSLGRYPRIRIARADQPQIWFELWMGLDEHGRRYERFRRD